MTSPLDRFARRMERDAFFLAAPLARYAASHGMNDDALAAALGCDPNALSKLRLCRNPDPMPPHFMNDIEHIAKHFGIDPDKLGEVVRFGQALLQPMPTQETSDETSPSLFMAARDDEAVKPDEESPP